MLSPFLDSVTHGDIIFAGPNSKRYAPRANTGLDNSTESTAVFVAAQKSFHECISRQATVQLIAPVLFARCIGFTLQKHTVRPQYKFGVIHFLGTLTGQWRMSEVRLNL